MYTALELLFGCVFAFCLGSTIVGLAIIVMKKNLSPLEDIKVDPIDAKKKVAPFIEIHQTLIEENGLTSNEDSVNRLKDKIESFKFRNRFYRY